MRLGATAGAARLDANALVFAEAVAKDLAAARGRAIVLAGEDQPAELHALCHWINAALRAPVGYIESLGPVETDHAASLAALADDLRANRIGALIVADANPVHDAPDTLGLAEALARLPFSAHLGQHRDETARCCQWHLPLSHPLESWGDGRAPDGVASLSQPLIRPLYDSRTRDEVLALLTGHSTSARDLTRQTWQPRAAGDFEAWWRTALHDGVIANSASTPLTPPAPDVPVETRVARAP
jgi:molybdopterin-containing oxidoreductase family iron-sulfur binding subunit